MRGVGTPGRRSRDTPYLLQHDPRWFPNPEEFLPDRFSKENEKKIPQGAYVPFAAGSRVCLGKAFALMEARLVLGTLVRRCRLRIADGYEPVLFSRLSLSPKDGMPADIVLRGKNTVAA